MTRNLSNQLFINKSKMMNFKPGQYMRKMFFSEADQKKSVLDCTDHKVVGSTSFGNTLSHFFFWAACATDLKSIFLKHFVIWKTTTVFNLTSAWCYSTLDIMPRDVTGVVPNWDCKRNQDETSSRRKLFRVAPVISITVVSVQYLLKVVQFNNTVFIYLVHISRIVGLYMV